MFWTRSPEPQKPAARSTVITVGNEAVQVRRMARVRRIRLSFDSATDRAILTLPPRTSVQTGADFVASQLDWIASQRVARADPGSFRPGGSFTLGEETILVHHDPVGPRTPRLLDARLIVGGPADLVEGRVLRWLINRARSDLTARVHRYATLRGRALPPVAIRDTRSRWGSCSRDGRINLCWRLIAAPEWVRDYVCAHEVAHLAHMNHGDGFWAEVATMDVNHEASRRWLRANGSRLLALGRR
jgi:predicted metal-dependent hydrolase